MIPGFSTKKIPQATTLGEKLKNARLEKGVLLSEAEVGTKVKAKYLAALENGNWDVLPEAVYARGFVLAYARYLALDVVEIDQLFERETAFYQRSEARNLSYNRSIKETKVLITPRLLAYIALSCFVVSMFSYIVFQVAGFAGSPNLKIMTPENNTILEQDNLDLAGVTDVDTFVTVNEEKVPVTSEGRFSLSLKLHRGVNVINVRAINKAKKESSEVYTVEYRPQTASASSEGRNF